ncbi:MAG: hypothetical protein M1832_002296 [Thelocarpon impressellum]|nr:MAG: hypothetical protein M1832_002296 [Thelocarpon impressellum]
MACTQTSLTVESYGELTRRPSPAKRTVSEKHTAADPGSRRRRHSFHHVRKRSMGSTGAAGAAGPKGSLDDDSISQKVDLFLSELERRLDFLEAYGNLNLDAGIARAYATLQAVRDSCSHVSGELYGAGQRRARVLVETLDGRYQGVLATRATLEQKIHTGIRLLEDFLADFEARAQAVGEAAGLRGMAGELMDEGRRRVDEGLEAARGVVDDGMERAWRAKDTLRHSIEAAIGAARKHGLIAYEDLPEPWKVNPHILRGYRFSESPVECVRSTLRMSNEFFNIWSHALGLLAVLALAFWVYPTSANFSLSSNADVLVAAAFFFAACKCLVCSTMWHTMNSIAEQSLMERFACVDYTGISLLIAASILTTEWTAFYCEPASRWTYMLATAALGVGGVLVPWHPTFNRADMRWARVAFYITLGVTGLTPAIQLTLSRGPAWSLYFYAPIAKSLAVYVLGALVYAAQIPERWCPGAFDYVGGSHNLWHLAVLGGILFHYAAMQSFFAGAFARAREGCSVS